MLDKFKKLKKLKDLQSKLKDQEETVEKQGVKVTVNGQMKLVDVELNPDLSKDDQEELIVECFNEAMENIRENVAGNLGM